MRDFSAAFERIEAFARRQIDTDSIPGISLAITDRENTIYTKQLGVRSIESGDPVRPGDYFEWGSIGKSFTCILLMQLADEGRVAINQPVADFLPWFSVQTSFAPITIHHLMTHTGGIINGTDFPADPRYEVWSLRDTVAVTPPGSRFHYSNVGYKALGLLLEEVTGVAYQKLVQDRILDPLGMRQTHPSITHATRKRLVTGHAGFFDDRPYQRSHGLAPATWLETDTADGCIAGTASDLATYLRMLINRGCHGGGRLLSEVSFAAMTSPHAMRDNSDALSGYGYGLAVSDDNGRFHLSHSGGMVGYFAHMEANITDGIGVVTMINGPGRQRPIVSFALEALHASINGGPLPSVEAQDQTAGGDVQITFSGISAISGDTLDLSTEGERAAATFGGERYILEPSGENTYMIDHPTLDRFPL